MGVGGSAPEPEPFEANRQTREGEYVAPLFSDAGLDLLSGGPVAEVVETNQKMERV